MDGQMGSHFCGPNSPFFLICFLYSIENWGFLCQNKQDNIVEWKEHVAVRFLVSKEKLQGIK